MIFADVTKIRDDVAALAQKLGQDLDAKPGGLNLTDAINRLIVGGDLIYTSLQNCERYLKRIADALAPTVTGIGVEETKPVDRGDGHGQPDQVQHQ